MAERILVIDDELGVVLVSEGMLQIVLHGVGDPRDSRVQSSTRFRDMGETLFQRKGLNKAILLGMGQ